MTHRKWSNNQTPFDYCSLPGPVAQSVGSLTADPGVASSIPARSYTFVEIDPEIISTTVILLLPLIQEGLLSVTSESMCTNLPRSTG